MLKKFGVEEIWSWGSLKLKKFENKKFEVEEIWCWRYLMFKKVEVEETWS